MGSGRGPCSCKDEADGRSRLHHWAGTNPATPTIPTTPTNPTNPTIPTNPTNPTNPATPTNPTHHTDPVKRATLSNDASSNPLMRSSSAPTYPSSRDPHLHTHTHTRIPSCTRNQPHTHTFIHKRSQTHP
eukprot:GHVU01127751.1.p5 GENE.GHVU01127751.1~~GHVU01127751.1.p5  ORF type:complete len:130 (-),score=8.60 GHVU01127751.1:1852-2241(-)